MMLLKCCTQYSCKFGKLSSGHSGPEKVSFHSNGKECLNYCTVALISHTSELCSKFSKKRLQQYMDQEPPDVQARFRKGRGTRDQVVSIHWITQKARELQKNSYSAFLTTPNPLTMWIPTDWKILRDWNTRQSYLPPEKSVGRSRGNS